ncbi:MAG: carboxylesterase/lipase family protein [Myxococcota bacterium]
MPVRIDTASGSLEGLEARGVVSFKGIPYAAPPVGKLRWRPPEKVRAWAGARPATAFGPSAPQLSPAGRLVRTLIGAGAAQSEDCLSLNVWTPAPGGPPRPVLVWIHGGAFVMGSGSTRLYSGSRIARRGDLVVVTLNYRLGALGFLNARELASGHELPAANLGTLDQIAALEWVRDHIEDFGGDPEQVTLFGESAGAMSVGTLLGTPRARGLFQRAILQSGAAHNVSSPARATEVARVFLRELGLPSPDPDRLERIGLDEILRAQSTTTQRMGLVDGRLPWQPSVDGDLLARTPLEAIAEGSSAHVPTLVGSNLDEWKLFMLGDRKGRSLDEEGWQRRLDRTLSLDLPDDESRRRAVRRAHETYTGCEGERAGVSPGERWCAFQSDRIFHYPATRLLEIQSGAGAPVYAYRFDWRPPLVGGRIGACHGIEIPFVFGTLRDPWLRPVLGSTRGARSLANRMQGAWIEFARSGRPGHPKLPDWPQYGDDRATLTLGPRCELRMDWLSRERRFWETVS